MTVKIVILLGTIALVSAGYLNGGQHVGYTTSQQHPQIAQVRPVIAPQVHAVSAPVVHTVPVVQTRVEPFDPHPRYSYAYAVNDQHTGDSKSQHEIRNGDVVRGQYSLTDPDGSRRTVDYSADAHNGFNAVVQRTVPHPAAHVVATAAVAAAAPIQLRAGH